MLANYIKLENGVIRQEEILDKIEYNFNYANAYNAHGDLGPKMAFMRLGFLIGALNGSIPENILDVGYGNGDFLKAATNIIPNCYGSDISGYPVPEGVSFVEDIYKDKFDVVCFFDVLEHFDNIYDISKLNANFILVSVPQCHYLSDEWFENWKHRKPGEHLWHFDEQALVAFFNEIGYDLVLSSNIEDTIRKPVNTVMPNILTCLFRKK